MFLTDSERIEELVDTLDRIEYLVEQYNNLYETNPTIEEIESLIKEVLYEGT